MKTSFGKKHVPALNTSFLSPAGLLLSPSIWLPLSFSPTPSQMETGRATLLGDRAPWRRVWSLEETPPKHKSPEPVEWTYLCLGFNIVPEKDRTLDTISLIIFLFTWRMVHPPNSLRAAKSQASATSPLRPHLNLSLVVNNVANFNNRLVICLLFTIHQAVFKDLVKTPVRFAQSSKPRRGRCIPVLFFPIKRNDSLRRAIDS